MVRVRECRGGPRGKEAEDNNFWGAPHFISGEMSTSLGDSYRSGALSESIPVSSFWHQNQFATQLTENTNTC